MMKRPTLCSNVDVIQRGSNEPNARETGTNPSPEVEANCQPLLTSTIPCASPASLSPTSSPQSRIDQGKRILQSAAASIMTMSLSPPASKNQKKQNSIGSSGSASPTPQLSVKMGKNNKLSIFKRPIEDVCRVRPPPDGRVEIPYILTSVCSFIEHNGLSTEGLFRVNGNSKTLEKLRQEYEKGTSVDLKDMGVDIASVAGLMKLYLRELPDPLVSTTTHHLLLKEWNKLLNFRAPHTASDCPALPAQPNSSTMSSDFIPIAIAILKQNLSIESRAVMGYLCHFLSRVTRAKEQTKMGTTALGIVFGPNIFRVDTSHECIKEQGTLNDMVAYFISNANSVFEPPEKISISCDVADTSPPISQSGSGSNALSDAVNIPCPSTPNPTPPTPAPTPTYFGSTPPTMRSLSTPKYFSTDPSPPPPDTPTKDIVIPLPRITAAASPAASSPAASSAPTAGINASEPQYPSSSSSTSALHFLSSGESDSTLPSDRESSPPSTRSSIERLGSSSSLVSKMAAQIIDQGIKEVVDHFLSADSADAASLYLLPGVKVGEKEPTREDFLRAGNDAHSYPIALRRSPIQTKKHHIVDDGTGKSTGKGTPVAESEGDGYRTEPSHFLGKVPAGKASTLAPCQIATVESISSSESSASSSEESDIGSDDENVTDSSSKPVFSVVTDLRTTKGSSAQVETTPQMPRKPYIPPLDLTTLGEHYGGSDPIPSRQQPSIVGNDKDIPPSRALHQAWGEVSEPKNNFSTDAERNTQKSQRSHYNDNLSMAARDALGSGGLASSSSGGSSPAIDIPNQNGSREGEASAHGRSGVEDVAVISPRTSRYMSRNRNHNNNNNNSYNTNNNNIHAPEKRSVLTVNVGAGKNVEEPRPSRLGSDGVSSVVSTDETDVPPSPPIDDTKTFKSAYSQKINNKKWQDPGEDASTATKVRQHTKKISHLKRKIKNWEENFEAENGFKWNSVNARDGQAARAAAYPELSKLMAELSKTRKELKAVKDVLAKEKLNQIKPSDPEPVGSTSRCVDVDQEESSGGGGESLAPPSKEQRKPTMDETLRKISLQLKDKRRMMNRSEELQSLSKNEVEDEKLALQKALLYFENIHGRPVTKDEKDLMRPIYDRYRNVKRMLARPISPKVNSLNSLQPIIEGQSVERWESLPNASSLPGAMSTTSRSSNAIHVPYESSYEGGEENEAPTPSSCSAQPPSSSSSSSSSQGLWAKITEASLHEASVVELLEYQRKAKTEKKRLRKILKEFEDQFQENAGRKVVKEDRGPMETDYANYKQVKQCLRLLDALLSKHES